MLLTGVGVRRSDSGGALWIVCYSVVLNYISAKMQSESDCIGVIGLLGSCSWTLALGAELF